MAARETDLKMAFNVGIYKVSIKLNALSKSFFENTNIYLHHCVTHTETRTCKLKLSFCLSNAQTNDRIYLSILRFLIINITLFRQYCDVYIYLFIYAYNIIYTDKTF